MRASDLLCRIRRFAVVSLLVAAPCVAAAQELPPGYGTELRSGSRVRTTLSDGADVDDYVIVGYPGATLRATLRVDAAVAPDVRVEFLRPDGSTVTLGDGLRGRATRTAGGTRSVHVRFALDALGPWTVRVRLAGATTPPAEPVNYRLSVRCPRPGTLRIDASEAEQLEPGLWHHAIPLPAEGGARVAFVIRAARGTNLSFGGLYAPDATPVTEFDPTGRHRPFRTRLTLDPAASRGEYVLALYSFSSYPPEVRVRWNVRPPRSAPRIRGALDGDEPRIVAAPEPSIGGPGMRITVGVEHAIDANDPEGAPTLLLDDVPLEDVVAVPVGDGAAVVSGTVPQGVEARRHDVVLRTSRGQPAVAADAFLVPPPPTVMTIAPDVGSHLGGFPVTVTGTAFRPGRVEVLLDGAPAFVVFLEQTATKLRFVAPSHAGGNVTFAVRDLDSQLTATLPAGSFAYVSTPAISSVSPGLVPILGGDTIRLAGFNFASDDRVYLETSTPGEFEEITATQTTFVDAALHAFEAPVRPAGSYEVLVRDGGGARTPWLRQVHYFDLTDFTERLGAGDDARDGWTTDLADFDGDGDVDVFVARRGSGPRSDTSLLALFENDGTGALTDVTDTRIPAPSASDDWRADRIRAIDVTEDGLPDLVLTTNDTKVPAPSLSHTRILVNERRSIDAPASDRVFRDRTLDLMAPPRRGKSGVSATDGDHWRGLDLWVGDLDGDGDGPPDILITHDETKEEIDVCSQEYNFSSIPECYVSRFYWGGSRRFRWVRRLRGGLGRYVFDYGFFQREQGLTVPIFDPPPGVVIKSCNDGNPCRGTFTPFTGHSLAVRDLNGDGERDVVVVSSEPVIVNGTVTSSTQVRLSGQPIGFNDPYYGSPAADVTPLIAALGGDTTGDAVAIAFLDPQGDDGPRLGTIVVAQRDAPLGGGPALRAFRYVPPDGDEGPGSFEDVTDEVIPSPVGADAWQAGAIAALDVDRDGRDDLVLLADAAPEPGAPALRILRTHDDGAGPYLVDDLRDLLLPLVQGGDPFDGRALTIGDLDGDGGDEFVVTRSSPSGGGTQTRAISTER